MNGPEHYSEAERLLDHAKTCMEGVAPEDCDTYEDYADLLNAARVDAQMDIAAAQVHATLALAAVSALASSGEMAPADANRWTIAVSSSEAAVAFAREDLARNYGGGE